MKTKKKVYIETSIVSYLSSRISKGLIQAANQAVTEEWWNIRRDKYELFTSQYVIDEARLGNIEAANRRSVYLSEIPLLEVNDECRLLSRQFTSPEGPLPAAAEIDASHIAMATFHKIDFLLTWNCRHIANAEIEAQLQEVAIKLGLRLPMLCTPFELMGE